LFDPTDGVNVSSLGSSSSGVGGVVVGVLPPMAGGVLGSAVSGVDSLMETSSVAPLLSMWKLNNPKAISKPPDLAKIAPVKLGMGSTVVAAGESKSRAGVRLVMLGDAMSTTVDPVMSTMFADDVVLMTAGTAMPTMVVIAVSTSMQMLMSGVDEAMLTLIDGAESTAVADDKLLNLVGVVWSAMVGEGTGESVDPDPIVPTVGAN
jgi:hypothetical protein